MHLIKLVLSSLSAGALAALISSCSVGVEPIVTTPPGAATGTVTVTWSVAGASQPSLCNAYGAASLELVIDDANGNEVTTVNAPCSDFSTTLTLAEGTYSAEATLVDSASNSRSVTKPLQDIDVVAGTDLAIDLDFPASSIL
jgi:hypothetical protein